MRIRLTTAEWRVLRQQVLDRDDNQCVWCGSSDNLTLHHINPLRRGGKSIEENLVTFCRACHDELERMEWQWDHERIAATLAVDAETFVQGYVAAQHTMGYSTSRQDERVIRGLLAGRGIALDAA